MAFDDNISHRPHPIDQVFEGFSSWYKQGRSLSRPRSKVNGLQSGRSRECGRSVLNWSILSQTERSFEPNRTVFESEWNPSCFIPLDRLVSSLKTIQFIPFGLSTHISKDRPVSSHWTVHFPLPTVYFYSFETVQSYYLRSFTRFPLDCPFWVFWSTLDWTL